MNWLREAISDGSTGRASSKRVAMLWAAFAMGVSLIILSAAAALVDRDLSLAIGAVTVPLAGLGGYTYVRGKHAENGNLTPDLRQGNKEQQP